MRQQSGSKALNDCELSRSYRLHRQQLIKLAMARGCSRELAEDICQEAFIRLQKTMRRENPIFIKAYLSKIAVNLIQECRRKDHRKSAILSYLEDGNYEISSQVSPDADRKRQGMMAIQAFQGLGEGMTGLCEFNMFYQNGWNSSTIAEKLDTNATTVRSRIQRFLSRHNHEVEQTLDQDFYAIMISQMSAPVPGFCLNHLAVAEC